MVGASGLDVERLLVKRHQSSGLKQEIDKLDVQPPFVLHKWPLGFQYRGLRQSITRHGFWWPFRVTRTVHQALLRAAIRERLAIIEACPSIGRIEGLPLRVMPERLVMRPPVAMGLDSFDDEQSRAASLPEYGETCIGAVRESR